MVAMVIIDRSSRTCTLANHLLIDAVGGRIAHGDWDRVHVAEMSWTVVVAMGRAGLVDQANASQ